jgi:hypothetical protein
VPAAAVIPAPLAYIKIVAVKTFEVYSCPTRVLLLMMAVGHWIVATIRLGAPRPFRRPVRSVALMPFIGCSVFSTSPAAITLNKLECSKQAILRPRIILHGIMEYDLGLNIHWFVIQIKR